MDKFKNVVFLMAVVCGFVVCTPGNTCASGESAVSKLDGKGVNIKSSEDVIEKD